MPEPDSIKSCWKFAVLGVCLICSVTLAAGEISEQVLANDLKVVVKPDQRSPIVVFQIWYQVGSANEQPGHTGISHLLEHLMYRGKKAPQLADVYAQMSIIGTRSNAYTSRDHTFYYHILRKEHIALPFALEADRMRHLSVDETEFNVEKEVIREEYRDRISRDPYLPATNALYELAFGDDGYQVPVIGRLADQPALTLNDTLNWHKSYYTPDNATLVVTGDVDPAAVFALAKKYFSTINKPGKTPENHFAKTAAGQTSARLVMPEPTRVGMVLVAFKVPSIKSSNPPWEAYALEVLAGWLDSGIHSRLTKALIRGRQVAHEVVVDYAPMNRRQTLFIIEATPAQGVSVQQLEQAILDEIELLKKERLNQYTFRKVKKQMISTEIFERDSMYIQAKIIGQAESVGIPWSEDIQYLSRIKSVTIKQVRSVLSRYLDPKNMYVVIQPAEDKRPHLKVSDE